VAALRYSVYAKTLLWLFIIVCPNVTDSSERSLFYALFVLCSVNCKMARIMTKCVTNVQSVVSTDIGSSGNYQPVVDEVTVGKDPLPAGVVVISQNSQV